MTTPATASSTTDTDQATTQIGMTDLAHLIDLLTDIDEFLRHSNRIADYLAAFYALRGDPYPRLAAATLLDLVGFTTAGLRHRHDLTADNHATGDPQ